MTDVLTYGVGGDFATQMARKNFKSAGMQGLSLCTTPIELLSNDGKETVLSRATGFFWTRAGRAYLITNYHVVSGRNAFTAELRPPHLFIPKRIAFYGVELSIEGQMVRLLRRRYLVILDDDFHEKILQRPPKVQGMEVDLFALAIANGVSLQKDAGRTGFVGAETASSMVNEHAGKPILTFAGDDCHILGYPLANYDGLMPPIWKRGSIASETNLGVDNRPIFLVDAATTAGMSGSPIFRKVTTITVENRDLGLIQEMSSFQFIGVYAGRLESSLLGSVNLGYAWYGSIIDDLIDTVKWTGPALRFEAGKIVGETVPRGATL